MGDLLCSEKISDEGGRSKIGSTLPANAIDASWHPPRILPKRSRLSVDEVLSEIPQQSKDLALSRINGTLLVRLCIFPQKLNKIAERLGRNPGALGS